MKNLGAKKYSVLFVTVIYILSFFFQSFLFFDFNKVYAQENQLKYTNLVAIFVDDSIYDNLQNEIEWYAKKYIQGADASLRYSSISNSKAIVLPVDTNTISAQEVTKILENMYFDGVSGEPSKLVGTVLIGDIPMPVVNQNGFIYPTIYPYVDFEEQKFIWNDDLKYFVYNDNPKGQPEIWHGLINFDSIQEYKNYFEKLKTYAYNPSDFIGKNIWYDDFVANKQYFYKEGLPAYINNFLFAEDIGYKRYSDLMIKIMQGVHNDNITNALNDFEGVNDGISISGGISNALSMTIDMNTPTIFLEKMIKEGYLQPYMSLFGEKQLSRALKNVETSNRWIETITGSDGAKSSHTAMDTHYTKIQEKDETLLRIDGGLDPLLISINDALEMIVDEKIEKEKYWLNEVIPLSYLEYEGYKKLGHCTWKVYDAYENYFFGTNAKYITDMKQISTYRGTFGNFNDISGLTVNHIQNNQLKSGNVNAVDVNKKSIGGSYDIFATQVDANRGYNAGSTIKELNIYQTNKIPKIEHRSTICQSKRLGICWKKRKRVASEHTENLCNIDSEEEQGGCETPQEFAMRNRGGASSLNLDANNNYSWKSGYNFQNAILPVFDIKGSKALISPEYSANSFKGIATYSRLIQKTFVPRNNNPINEGKYYTKNKEKKAPDLFGFGYNPTMGEDMKFTNRLPTENLENPIRKYVEPKKYNDVNFFNNFNAQNTKREQDIVKIIKETGSGDCLGSGKIYTYRTLDSRVKNNMSLGKDLSDRVYKIFEDPESPSVIFYKQLEQKIDLSLSDTLSIVDDLQGSGTGEGVMKSLKDIKNHVNSIKIKINNIISQSTGSISNMNSTEIQNLSSQWQQAFRSNDVDIMDQLSEIVQDQLIGLFLTVNDFDFEDSTEFIKSQIEGAQLMGNDLLLLNTWKNELMNKVDVIKNNIHSITGLINNVENYYQNIDLLNMSITGQLQVKYNNINALNNGEGCNSNSPYKNLCNAINTVKNTINSYGTDFNAKISGIENTTIDDDDDENGLSEMWGNLLNLLGVQDKTIFEKIQDANNEKINNSRNSFKTIVDMITKSNSNLTGTIAGIDETTLDRPIDSPKYVTFKGIGGDEVIFIYPNLYKAEVFSGNNLLKLKSPEDVSKAIKNYLREVVKKYNSDINNQKNKRGQFFNQHSDAFELLGTGDILANPRIVGTNDRPYNTISENYLIVELEKKLNNNAFFRENMGGYEPIDFLAHIIYYQNLGRGQRELGATIQEDIDNTISDFDVNEKMSHTVQTFLIKDNNKGSYITPGYRDDGYEVAFINSDGNDYISAKAEPPFIQGIKSASTNYSTQSTPTIEQSNLEEELTNECNIPESEGVDLFKIEGGEFSSPWINALKCWREKTKKSPFNISIDRSNAQGPVISPSMFGGSFGETAGNIVGIDSIESQYLTQLGHINSEGNNQHILDNSNPGDYQKLDKILSYTKLETDKTTVNADNASGIVSISSTIKLGNVNFYIKNVGNSVLEIKETNSSPWKNISEGTAGFTTGNMVFDPFHKRDISFRIQEPKVGSELLVLYMCLPDTTNIDNCVKKTLKLNIVPGQIDNVKIIAGSTGAMQGSKIPISVIGEDKFGNNVGQLITERFEISTSTGNLTHQNSAGKSITFSDFNKSDFILNVDKNTPNNTTINIRLDGSLGGVKTTFDTEQIKIVQGNIKVYGSGTNATQSLNINLPQTNEYSYKDSFDIHQTNLTTTPKIKIKLQDTQGNLIGSRTFINISSKNGLVKPGDIEQRNITKKQNNNTFQVTQKRFSQKNSFTIESGELLVYLMPNFKAGQDTISITIPGLEPVLLNVTVNPAPANMIEINTEKDTMMKNSSTKANLKVYDNRGNLVDKNTQITLGVAGTITMSGINSPSLIQNVLNGNLDFEIKSRDKGGDGFIYATINGLELIEQKPGSKTILVQGNMLPEKNLNIMYLSLFGSDRGNQRGFMSDNKKYVQNLINNSEKLITTTTQLIDPDNIRQFPVVISKKLHFTQIEQKNVSLQLDNKLVFDVEGLGEINVSLNEIDLKGLKISDDQLESKFEHLTKNTFLNKNAIIYLSQNIDSLIESNEVKNNSIWVNGNNIFNLNNKKQDTRLSVELSNRDLGGYQIWETRLDGKLIGELVFVFNKENAINLEIQSDNIDYDAREIWINGSTNQKGFGFFRTKSSLTSTHLGYPSIQDSKDPTLGIGFTADFKNISEFGAGKSVGEATTKFASEFLINIGDPLLKRINSNENSKIVDPETGEETDSGFDRGLGETIYAEPGKTILKVINMDFNNDELEDVIVAFTDGTIKLLKNYGGNNPFKQIGDLMVLADGIKEIIIGDVDGNGYKDIIIWNNSDMLRVYKNSYGVFDVDGLPICINTNVKDGELSEIPQIVSGIGQIFFEDMNNDGALDIITNDDKGYIKIFYGGQTNGKDNYVSTNKNLCDDNWYQRQSNNTNVVYTFGLKINEAVKVLDNSLVRWKGINPDIDETQGQDSNTNVMDVDAFDNLDRENLDEDSMNELIENALSFDVNVASEEYASVERYKVSDIGTKPFYEDVENNKEIEYVDIGCLTGSDPVKTFKKYVDMNGGNLENGDKVQVSVVITALSNFTGTFIDMINGPRIISTTGNNNMIENFWFETGTIAQEKIDNELKFFRDLENGRYMIDNISMNTGEEIIFHYRIFYDENTKLNKISIEDVDGKNYDKFGGPDGEKLTNRPSDNLKDIKILPTDGCNKSMFVLFNENLGNKKTYFMEYMDLAKSISKLTENSQDLLEDTKDDIINTFSPESQGGIPNMNNIPGVGSLTEIRNAAIDIWSNEFNTDNILANNGLNITNALTIAGNVIDGLAGKITKGMDSFLKSACDGFDLSKFGIGGDGSCGLPIPFNQAFLAPGNYHIFGCFQKPLLPVTETLGKGLPIFAIPTVGPVNILGVPVPPFWPWNFQGAGGLFDLFGPPSTSQFRLYVIPTLTAHIGVAMCFGPYNGLHLPSPLSDVAGNCIVMSFPLPCNKNDDEPDKSNKIPDMIIDLGDTNACDGYAPCYMQPGESYSSLELVSGNGNTNNLTLAIPDGSFAGGFIRIDKTPVTKEGYQSANIKAESITLKGGTNTKNKILGGKAKGFMKELVQNVLDKQIDYIFNNLSNFKLDIKWPNFEGFVKTANLFKSIDDAEKEKNCEGERDAEKKKCRTSPKQACENKGKEWSTSTETCNEKVVQSQNEGVLGKIENRSNKNMISRGEIEGLSNYGFANPFEKVEKMFDDISLINLRTENIVVNVPMITSEDISAYVSLSKNWIKTQEKTLEKWKDLLKSILGVCGREGEIENFDDIKEAADSIKQNLEKQYKEEIKNLEKQKNDENKNQLTQQIDSVKQKLEQIKQINKLYDLNKLGNYTLFEGCNNGEFFIRVDNNTEQNLENIIPHDVYILYKPNSDNKISMFTQGYDLVQKKSGKKTEISIEKNGERVMTVGLCLKEAFTNAPDQCVELFLGGKFNTLLNNFFNIQTNTTLLISSIRQNLDTLELYKKFPLELYEWIHVGDRYLGETASLVNNLLGTLSMRAQTNATRYSQYVDSIILIKTVLETYQAIIDVSANWSEKCGSCTQDNYDQFACKLSMLCPDSLGGIVSIPPFKIPSIFMDLSKLNLGIDIKLPKLSFKTTAIPLPKLPNLPEPPKFDLSVDVEQAMDMGVDILGQLMEQIGLSINLEIPAIPLIPEPPTLPQLPSFIPNIKMDLPLLPPAPKIPKLPNALNTVIETVEVVAKILCIVKKKFGLVQEDAIKAKVEQMTQRTYEIPYWDNLEQNILKANAKIPEWLKESFSFLQSNAFQDANLQGMDIGIEAIVDINFNFDGAFDIINTSVNTVNKYTNKYTTTLAQSGINWLDEQSRDFEQRMSVCVSNPVSKDCLRNFYTDRIDNLKKEVERLEKERKEIYDKIISGEQEYYKLIQEQEKLANEKDKLENIKNQLQEQINNIKEVINTLEEDLAITTNEGRIVNLNEKITKNKTQLNKAIDEFNKNQIELYEITQKLDEFNSKHGKTIEKYKKYFDQENELKEQRDEAKNELMEDFEYAKAKVKGIMTGAIGAINSGIQYINENDTMESIKEWNDKIQKQLDERQESENLKQEQRKENVRELYRDLDDTNNISYVDYDRKTYEESKQILTTTINSIIEKSDNQVINKQMSDALGILNSDHKLVAQKENIKTLEQKYLATIEYIVEDNRKITDLLKEDYDKFLYAIQNDKSLVNDGNIEASLSTNLFDIDKNLLENIKGMPNIHEQYVDYYDYQINGYLNALTNNSAETLNMSQKSYEMTKNYMAELSEKTKLASNSLKNKTILAQSIGGSSNNSSSFNNNSNIDLASYVNMIRTPQGAITLANDTYTKTFQGKYISADINGDGKEDLILWDNHNVYVKYKDNNNMHHNGRYYTKYYKYNISSYQNLLQNSDEGFIKINDIYVKLCDEHREVKNFKYNGGDYDSITINWSNSRILGDEVDGYLVKMIHRSDLFNDKEKIVTNSNRDFFDKKYVLVLPKGSNITGAKVGLEEGIVDIISQLSGLIWEVQYYNEGQNKVSLTLVDIPRNWQYSEIYTLKLEGENLYQISNPSSNQIVGGPQIVGDMRGPISNVALYRPSINELIDEGENFELYVGTRYILKTDWEDHIGLKTVWVSDDDGNIIKQIDNVNNTSGTIQLDNLYFTGEGVQKYYFVATNILGNTNNTQVTLNIKSPEIKINDINTYGEMEGISIPMSVIAELSHDIDEGYVQFLRKRNTNWEIITGSLGGLKIDKYKLNPLQTVVTGGYFDFGNDIGLYLSDGNLAVKINPNNGKISIENGYENRISLKLDFTNKTPMVKILDGNEQIFAVVFSSKELLKLETNLETRKLEGDSFGEFNGGDAIMYNDDVLMYLSPRGRIFVEETLYGDYVFNEQNQSVIYKFRKTESGNNLGQVEIKIKNLLGE